MTYDGATTYTWDARNRLGAFGSTVFAYDSFGRRTQNASSNALVYDGMNAVQELSGTTVTANLLTGFGTDEIFTRTGSAGVRNLLRDALGSTLALTDSSGTLQTQYSYEPFGKATTSGVANNSTFQYTGRENDGTGLYYYRARYYNPTFERFISEDPLALGCGVTNQYCYANNNPVQLGDPSGLATVQVGGTVTVTVPFIGGSVQLSGGIRLRYRGRHRGVFDGWIWFRYWRQSDRRGWRRLLERSYHPRPRGSLHKCKYRRRPRRQCIC